MIVGSRHPKPFRSHPSLSLPLRAHRFHNWAANANVHCLTPPSHHTRHSPPPPPPPPPPPSARLGSVAGALPSGASVSPLPARSTTAAAAVAADHRRGRSSAVAIAPPIGAPSLLASFYPSVTVMQA